jgi:hypothetical protein
MKKMKYALAVMALLTGMSAMAVPAMAATTRVVTVREYPHRTVRRVVTQHPHRTVVRRVVVRQNNAGWNRWHHRYGGWHREWRPARWEGGRWHPGFYVTIRN